MAKQLSLKQQIYQQIANKQVQEVLNKQREQETASLMADFNSWQQQRQDPAQLMADFDAWKQQNAAPQPQEVRQTIPSIADIQPVVHEQTEMEKHIAEVTKAAKEKRLRERAQKLQQLEQIEASQPHSKKERETLADIEDISKKLTNVVPETEALNTVTKTWKRGQRPEATDTSSQVAARVTNEKKPKIDTTNVPVNVDRWLSPDTKLTEAEKKKAKEYASAELQKVQYGPNKMPLFENEEQRQHYADMVNLINKTNGFTNFMSGAIEVPYNLADMVSDGARSVGNQLGGLGAAITDKLGVTEGATKRHNEQAEIANQFADQNEANMRQNFKNAQTQNPGAYTAGKIAGQTGMYMLTNPVFDGIAAGAGVESELAKFFINQGAQNVQDLVLDTAPTVRQLMEDGSTPEEVKREALSNILWNVVGNAVMGGLGAWAGNRAARKASDEAFRENVRAGADNLSRIANEIPGIEDVDNVVRNATRQAEEATKNIEDIAQQIPKLPEENYATDIYKDTEPLSIAKDPYYLTQEEFEAGQKRLQDYLNEPNANNKALTENNIKQNSFGSDIDNALNDIQSFIDGFSGEKELHKELTDSLDEVKNAIRNGGDIEGARAKLDNALNSAAEIVQQDNDSLLEDITSEAFQKVKSATDGSVIRLNKSVLKDALGDDAIFSDLNNMVYTGKGSIKFREGSGVPIDSIYNELRGLSDYELPEAHTEADQVAAIAKYISDVKAKNITPDNSAINEVKRLGNSLDEVIGNYNPNKVMAEEISKPKSDIITSEPIEPGKYEIPDTPENAPKTDDLWDELSGNKAPETPTTAKIQEIDDKGRKLSKLHSTLQNTDKLTEAEKKTFYDKNGFWYDPDVERELAANTQKEIEDIGLDAMYDRYMGGDMSGKKLSGQDTHNMFTTSFDYNKMAQEALQNGDEDLAKLYESKARNIMLQARETATDYGKFNAAIAYYSRTPQGYIDKAYNLLGKQITDFKSNNPKLANDIDRFAKGLADDLKDVDVDGIMSGTDEAAKQSLRQRVYDSLEDMLKNASPQAKQKFSNLSDAELDDIIVSKYEKDLARTLDMFSMGSYGVKPETVDKVLDLFAEAEKYDISSKQYYKAEKEAFDLLANDLMSGNGKSFREKFDAWRYFAMLANPLTHAKNIGGNINNKVLVGVKNNIAAALEDAADKVAKAKGRSGIEGGRTKAFLSLKNDGALLDGADEFFDQHAYREFKQGGNKWINVGQELAKAGDTFSNKRLAGRVVNKLTEGNSNILDAEDIIAGKATFKTSMAGFLKANGADASIFTKTDDASKQLLEQAKTYALQQANEATFHQTNELAQAISRFIKEGKQSPSTARRIFSGALDFMVPFVKTPGNILKACYEYSPLEFITVVRETKAWKKGAVSTAKYIDDISKGLTGTIGLGIGALLSAAGILNVSSGNDTEDTFNKKRGITTPSIRLGNASFKISELAPGAMPLIIGATVYETIKNSKKSADAAADTIFNGLSAIGDTVTDMTMLSGIASTLNDIRYAKDNTEMWGKLGLGVATNAAGQVLPTIGRKIEQTVDDTARSTYSGQDSKLLRTLDSNAKYWKTKVPMLQEIGEGLEKSKNQHIANIGDFLTNEPQINAWGEEIKNPDYNLSKLNKGLGYLGRGVHNTLDVFDTQINSSNKLDNSLRELASSIEDQDTKDKVLKYGLQPSTYDASVDGQRMSEKQWTEYQKGLGKTKSDLLNSLISSDSYEKMSPEDKAATLDLMSNFAKNYNQDKVVGKELDSFNKKLADLYGKGKIDDVVKTIRDKQTVNAAGYDYKEGSAAVEAIKDMDEEARQEYVETSNNLNDYGLTSQSAQATWDKVQKTFEKKHKTVPTMDEFVKTYNAMDTDGNKSLKQDELCNYFTKNNFSQSDADLYWEAYGSSKWKQVPVFEGNKWTHK